MPALIRYPIFPFLFAAFVATSNLHAVEPNGTAGALSASIGIAPARLELDWNGEGSTHSFHVVNVAEKPIGVEVSLASWDIDESGTVRTIRPQTHSLQNWIAMNPLRFTLPPGKTQTVRFSLRPKRKPGAGEHRAMVYIKEVPVSDQESEEEDLHKIRFRFGLPIYLQVGKRSEKGTLHGARLAIRSRTPELALDFTNTGNTRARLSGSYAVWPADKFPRKNLSASGDQPRNTVLFSQLPDIPILPGARRTLRVPFTPPRTSGRYGMTVSGEIAGNSFTQHLTFSR